jgi:sporulation protein YlmC with PRC-barrel domain
MHKIALALLVSAALSLPALAQSNDDKKDPAKKVAIPIGTFFKRLTPTQYLARERLIGADVVNKDNQTIGTIEDLIVTSGGNIEGVVLSVGGFLGAGEKKIGVRMVALKITNAGGKTIISLPGATKEMLRAVGAYQQTGDTPDKK